MTEQTVVEQSSAYRLLWLGVWVSQKSCVASPLKLPSFPLTFHVAAHFTLPTPSEGFTQIDWVEQKQPAAIETVALQKSTGQAWLASVSPELVRCTSCILSLGTVALLKYSTSNYIITERLPNN